MDRMGPDEQLNQLLRAASALPVPSEPLGPATALPLTVIPDQHTVTRVMSPNVDQGVLERWGLRGYSMQCEVCQALVSDPWVCSACYKSGHQQCLKTIKLEGYAFCISCQPWAIDQYSRFTTAAQRQCWTVRLAGQLANWREVTVSATGALGAVGVALGGAGAMVVGGTAALVCGAVQGARAASRSVSPAALADKTEENSPQAATTEQPPTESIHGSGRGPPAQGRPGIADSTRTRAQSEEPPRRLHVSSLAEAQRQLRPAAQPDNTMAMGLLGKKQMADMAGHCLACHTDNRGHYAHLNKGDCL